MNRQLVLFVTASVGLTSCIGGDSAAELCNQVDEQLIERQEFTDEAGDVDVRKEIEWLVPTAEVIAKSSLLDDLVVSDEPTDTNEETATEDKSDEDEVDEDRVAEEDTEAIEEAKAIAGYLRIELDIQAADEAGDEHAVDDSKREQKFYVRENEAADYSSSHLDQYGRSLALGLANLQRRCDIALHEPSGERGTFANPYQLGETAQFDDITVTITSTRHSANPPDQKTAVITANLVNKQAKDIEPEQSFIRLADRETGNESDVDYTNCTVYSEIVAGQSIAQELCFRYTVEDTTGTKPRPLLFVFLPGQDEPAFFYSHN